MNKLFNLIFAGAIFASLTGCANQQGHVQISFIHEKENAPLLHDLVRFAEDNLGFECTLKIIFSCVTKGARGPEKVTYFEIFHVDENPSVYFEYESSFIIELQEPGFSEEFMADLIPLINGFLTLGEAEITASRFPTAGNYETFVVPLEKLEASTFR